MKVLQAVAPGGFGGAETVVAALSRGLVSRGHGVRVAATLQPGAEEPGFLGALRGSGVEVDALRVPARGYPAERRGVRDIARSWGADVLHTHGYRSDLVGLSAARAAGIPAVTTVHGFTGGDLKNRCYQWLQRRSFRRFDAVVAVSEPLARELRAALPSGVRIELLPNAWVPSGPSYDRESARRELGLPAEGSVVGWVGRFSPEKGPDVMVEAARRLAGLPLIVSMVGGGSSPPVDLANVRCHGPRADAWRLLRAFDVLALSSRTEGTPMILLEAGHLGVPIVATRVGGVADLLGEEGGWLVPPDDPAALASAIADALEAPSERERRARALEERLKDRADPGRWIDAHERLYESLSSPAEGEV